MATAYTWDDKAIKEDLMNLLTNLSPTDTQLVTGLKQSKASSVYHEWLIDTLDTVADNAYVEGVDASYRTLTSPSRVINTTQILRKGFQVSDTERAVDQAAFDDRYSYEMTKAMKSLKNDMEFAVMRGSIVSLASTSAARKMRGIKNSLSLVTSQSGVSLSESALNDYFQLVWDNSSTEVDEVYGSMYIKRKISAFNGNANYKQISVKDRRLINAVDVYSADAAKLVKLFAHRHVTVSGDTNYDIVGIDSSKFAIAYLRSVEARELAKTGDSTKGEVLTECTLEHYHPNAGFYGKAHL